MGALITWFDQQFAELNSNWRVLVQRLAPESIYQRPLSELNSRLSCGEYVVKSARVVEQTFGGITANLWDDPFEWTLPETLTTPAAVLDYLREVDATRRRGFDLLKSDEDLTKEIVTASGPTQLFSLLLDTLMRAGHHLLNARDVLKLLRSQDRATRAMPS